jgi:TatA/E family protein of Tat protein translocase
MFGPLGLPEILMILVLALLIFGPKRLPEVGRTIGKGLGEFRRASADLKRTVNAELALDEDERPHGARRPEAARTPGEAAALGRLTAATAGPPGATPRGETEAAEALPAAPPEAGELPADLAPEGEESAGAPDPAGAAEPIEPAATH